MKKTQKIKLIIALVLMLVVGAAGLFVLYSNRGVTEVVEVSQAIETPKQANSNSTVFTEFVKKDGSKYSFNPTAQKVTDMEEKEVLYGSYQFNHTGASSIVSAILRNTSTITIDDQWYSKLSTKSGYEWLAQFEDDSLYTLKDSSGNLRMRGNSSAGELVQYDSGDRIHKAYLVVAERGQGYTHALEDFPITLVGPNGKYIETKMENVRHSGSDRHSAYMDVTEFVKDQGYGWYYCCNLPYVYHTDGFGTDQYSSWKLIVIEENADLPLRALTLKLGYRTTASSGTTATVSVGINAKDIMTKSEGEVTGQILYSLEGADIGPNNNFLSLVVDGATQSDFYKEGSSTSVLRTDAVPVIEKFTRNGKVINNMMVFDSEASSIKNYTARTYTNSSKTYTIKGNLMGSDTELLDIDSAKTNTNLTIGNSKGSVQFRFRTSGCVLQANALGLVIDIEGTEYDNEIKTEIDKGVSDQTIIVSGTSQNTYGNNDTGLYETVTTIQLDSDITVDSEMVAVDAYWVNPEDGTNIIVDPSDISVDGNNVMIKWGEDTNGVTDLTLYGYTLYYEISGLTVGNFKEQYENLVSVTGKLYSSGVATDKGVGDLGKQESYLEYKDIVIEKIWLDDNNSQRKRPETITVELYREGTDDFMGAYDIPCETTASSQTYTIPNVLVKDDNNTYTYYIREVGSGGGSIKSIVIEDDNYVSTVNGMTITNRLTGIIGEVPMVTWDDLDNENSTRPETITMQLLQNGEIYEEYVLDVENEFEHEFMDLPKYDENGKLYEYTVQQKEVLDGYETFIEGFEIINVLNMYDFQIEYYFDGVLDEEKTDYLSGYYKDTIVDYEDKSEDGYEFDRVETVPMELLGEGQVVKVYYKKRSDLSYTVNYLEQGTEKQITESKVVYGQTYQDEVTETAIDVEGYNKVDPTEATITIDIDSNEINFYYTKRTDLEYTVNYLEQGTQDSLAESKTVTNQTYEDVVTENAVDVEGYNKVDPSTQSIKIDVSNNIINFYYTKRTDISYTVNYYEQGTTTKVTTSKTVNDKTYKDVITETAVDVAGYNKVEPLEVSIELGVSGNVINFYYTKRTDIPYTVKYLEEGTNAVLATEKTVENNTFKSVVTEKAIDIVGYNKPSNDSQTITIEAEGNEIIFYYTRRTDIEYTVNYLEKREDGTESKISTSKVVTGQIYLTDVTEEAIDVAGYNKEEPTSQTITLDIEDNVINFYYTKRTDLSYTVKYLEKNTNIEVAESQVVENQTYLSEVTEEAIDVSGYNKVAPTEKTITIKVDSNEIIFYYTKRTDIEYTVNYLEKSDEAAEISLTDSKVVTGKTYLEIVTENAIDIKGYVALDPTTQSIALDVDGNEINFYYTKRTDLKYTVNYYEKDTSNLLAESKVVENQTYLAEVTEYAIEIEGYNQEEPTEKTITIDIENNVINFYYTKRTDLSYTVKYIEQNTNISVLEDKVVTGQTYLSTVTESAIEVDGYYIMDPTTQSITIKVEGNVITFYYVKRNDLSYTVNYYEDGTEKSLAQSKTVSGQSFGNTVTEQAIDIEGYIKKEPTEKTITIVVSKNEINFYYTKRTDLEYTVKYLEIDTNTELADRKVVTGQKYLDKITEQAIDIEGYDKVDPTSKTIEIKVSGNEITFYYTKRTDLSYTVNYYEEGTENKLAESKVVNGQKYLSTATEEAIDIEGYDKVEPTSKTITINVENNVINFYYTKRTDLKYTVNYIEKGNNTYLAESKVVENQTYLSSVTEEAITIKGYVAEEPTSKTIEIKVSGNEITFYYTKRADLSYTVNYYEEGTENKLTNSKVVNGQTYMSEVTEKAIEIEGYAKIAPTEKTIIIDVEGNVINFYYKKVDGLSYTVKYLEKGTNNPVADEKTIDGLTFKDVITEDAIDIAGYVKEEPSSQTIEIKVSGNEIIFYYTKRTDLEYTVNYLEKSDELAEIKLAESKVVSGQTYLATVTEKAIDIEGYVAQEPTTQSITINVKDNVINFYYAKRTDLEYTVNYLEQDTNEIIAESKVVTGQTYLQEITEYAIDVEGYVAVDPTSQTITVKVEGNVINFYYTKRTDLSYTVKYLEQGTNAVLADEKVVGNQTFKSTVTENAIDIEGYNKLDPKEQTITIKVENNEIIFYYAKRTDLEYTVNYLEKDTDAVLAESKKVTGQTYLAEVTENAIDIKGYDKVDPTTQTIVIKVENNVINFYYTKRTDLEYTVNYLEKNTNAVLAESKKVTGQTYLSEVTENAIEIKGYNKVDPTTQSITIDVENNVINFYYTKRTDLSYTVKYLEQDTNKVLAENKVVNGQTYLAEVTESAIDIKGYTKQDPTTKTITIDVENNEIVFYYKKIEGLSYTVKYLEQGTNNPIAEEKTVEGNVYLDEVTENAIDIPGYVKQEPATQSITIDIENNEIIFYYTKRTDLEYTVNYLEKTEESAEVKLAESKVVTGQTYLQEVTEQAIDIKGYVALDPTKQTITINVSDNVINFYYTKRTDISYTVNYLEEGTENVLAESKVVKDQTYLAEITENAIDIKGYNNVEPTKQTITLDVEGNVINFYYTKRTDLSYTVKYLEKDTNAVLKEEKIVTGQTYLSEVTEEAIDITGYDKVEPTTKTITIKVENNEITFYYTKRTDLEYTVNYLEKTEESAEVKLAESKVVKGQTYLQEVTENAINIPGYVAVEPTSQSITIDVADNVINFYYTKRTDLVYTVNYLEKGTNEVLAESKVVNGQTYLSSVTEYAIDIEGYIKEEPTENTIVINVEGNTINFYYTKRTDLSYTVKYLEQDTNKALAENKVVNGQTYLAEVTENAIDIIGYTKQEPTTKTITIKVENNEIIFYYKKMDGLSYTVKYLEEGTNNPVAEEKTVDGKVYLDEVTETAIDVKGYVKQEPTTKSITIDVENNEIIFYYTKRTDLEYTVNYLEKTEESAEVKLAESKVVTGQTYLAEVTEQAIDIEGYVKLDPTVQSIIIDVEGNVINFYYTKRTDLTYTVNYLEEGTDEVLSESKVVNGQTYLASVTEHAIDVEGYVAVEPTSQTITIMVNDNVINFYYTKRTDLTYTVNYLEKGTDEVLSESKVVNNQTYLQEVTENAIEIEGYVAEEPKSQSITIKVEGNVINFYYTKRTDLSYTVNYLEKDTNKVLAESKVVTGQTYLQEVTENAIDIVGYVKQDPTTQTITIKVDGNVINFYYAKRTDLSYTVNYLEKDTNEVLAESKVVNGQTYLSEVTENAIDIDGYVKEEPTEVTITIDVENNVINFYYTKRSDLTYTVKYLEQDTNVELAESKVVTDQVYLSSVTEKAIDITGYTKQEPTSQTITIGLENNEIIFYYKKIDGLNYTVKYLEQDTNVEVADSKVVDGKVFNDVVTEEAIDVIGYVKQEPTSQIITIGLENNEIIFYYTKRTDLEYTVNYLEKREESAEIKLAESKTVTGQTFGEVVTEQAIDIEGYVKEEPSSQTITIDVADNVINFYYTKRTDLSYTVNYLEKDTNAVLAESKVVTNQTYLAEVTEYAIDIEGYVKQEPVENTIIIAVNENVINFYYEKRTDLEYTVNYFEQGTENKLTESKVVIGQTFLSEVTEDAIDIKGYDKVEPTSQTITIKVENNVINFYYIKRDDLTYTVNYLEKDTNEVLAESKVVTGQTYLDEITEEALDIEGYVKEEPSIQTITIDVDENVINFYYTKRTDLSYTVNYLEEGTENVLAESKVVNGQTYLAEVTENAIDIAGYNKVDPTSKTIVIQVSENEITFYYTKRTDLKYTVKYLEQDTNEELADSKVVENQTYLAEVTEKAIDIIGYTKQEPTSQTITIGLENNEIIFYYKKIEGLTYTVKYLEQDTNVAVADEKIVDGNVFGDVVTEEAIDVRGYDKVEPTSKTITIAVENNEITFYYTKRTDLEYTVNYLEKTEESAENKLAESKVVKGQTYMSEANETAIDIEGYVALDPKNQSITIDVEGNEINFYYEKRTDLSYTVNYLEKDTNQVLAECKVVTNQTYLAEVTEYAIDIEGYVKEEPSVQELVVEVGENVINFYYTKRTDLEYTVNYFEKGTENKLAESKVVSGQTYLQEVTEKAIEIEGYVKQEPTEQKIVIKVENNVINFYYEKRTDLSYTVKYLEEGTEAVLAEEKIVNNQTFNSTVTENAIDIEGYTKVNPTKTIIIKVNDNEIIFYYKKVEGLSYIVKYLEQDTNVEVAPSKTVDGKVFGDVVTEEAIDVEGYNKQEPQSQTITIQMTANEIIFYYTKRSDLEYVVNYYEEGTENAIADSKIVENQVFGSVVTEQAIDVEGYVKVEPTEVTINIGVNENVINFYYTKRTDLSYIVNYLERGTELALAESKTVTGQTYMSEVTENAVDINGYVKEEPTEQTITIDVDGNVINFYYTKRTDLTYTVKYLEEGTDVEVAPSKVIENQTFNSTVTEQAIDVEGYTKVNPTETIVITTEKNEIIFYYKKIDGLTYTVKYLEKDTNVEVAPEKVVDGNVFGDIITEDAIDVEGYTKVDPTSQTITIAVENNEIIFYYTKRTDLEYTVNYLEALEETEKVLAESKVVTGQTYMSEVTENAIEIPGYVALDPTTQNIVIDVDGNVINFYYTKRTDLEYTVNYLEEGSNQILAEAKVVTGQRYQDTVVENAIDIEGYDMVEPISQEIIIDVDENVINFYYTKRTDLEYTVNYLEQGTEEVLAESKVVTDQTYKSNVTEEAIEIEGYTKVEPTSQTIEIDVDGNVINFYYTKRTDLEYTVKYLELGTENVLAEEKIVTGQIFKSVVTEQAIDILGYTKQEPIEQSIEIAVENNEIIFYYKKIDGLVYTVKYLEQGTEVEIAPEKVVDGNTFNDVVLETAIEIEGYNGQEPLEQSIVIGLDENIIKFYYTKRSDLEYVVNYYEEGTENAIADSKVVENQTYLASVTEQAIDIEGYDKVEPTEKTIQIALKGNEINFYYTKRTDLSYTVNYLEDETNAVLAESKVVTGQTYLQKVTEQAIDIEGYEKKEPKEQTIEINIDGNVITFYYTKRTDLSYTVRYLEAVTEKELAEEKVVDEQTYLQLVTEQAIDILGYNKQEPKEQTIEIKVDGNVITFYYTKRSDLSYTVKYLEKDTNVELAETKVVENQVYIDEITEEAIDIIGYTKEEPSVQTITADVENNEIIFYYTKVNGLVYVVNYIDEQTSEQIAESKVVDGKEFQESVTETAIEIEGYVAKDPTSQTIEMGLDVNEINFYYTRRTDLKYEVNYYEEGTENKVAESKVVDGQTFKSMITEKAISIEGYNAVEPAEQTIEIAVEENKINFYYARRTDLSYVVNYYEEGTENKVAESKMVENQVFNTTVTEEAIDIEGYTKVAPEEVSIVIAVEGNEINFYYARRNDLSYTVKYLEEETENVLAESKVVENQIYKTTVTENAIEIEGYNAVEPVEQSIEIDVIENEIVFYYTKRTDLEYIVKYLEEETLEELAPVKVVEDQTYLQEVTERAVEIEGYMPVDPMEQTIIVDVENNEIIFYYTKLGDLAYTVRYLEKDTQADVAPEKLVENKYYKDVVTENAIEVEGFDAVDPTSQTIEIGVAENEIIFYYTKRTDLSYTVKYVEQGTNKELAPEKKVEGKTYQEEVTEQAIEIVGYKAVEPLEQTIVIGVEANEIVFYYNTRTDFEYTVKYADQETGEEISPEKKVEGKTFGETVTEQAIDVEGYKKVDPTEKTIVIGTETNEIIFYYAKRTDLSYVVNYYEEGTNTALLESKVVEGKRFKEKVLERAIEIDGYTAIDPTEQTIEINVTGNEINFYYTKRADLSYIVRYLEKDTNQVLTLNKVVENQVYESTVTEKAIDIEGYNAVEPLEQSLKIGLEENVITFYYIKKTDLSYTVKYVEDGTDIEIAPSKLVENQKYQSQVTEQAIDVAGYNKLDPTSKTLTIAISGNEIVFYYAKRTDLEYTVNYLEQESLEKLAESKVVTGQTYKAETIEHAIDIAGYDKVNPEERITIDVENNVITFYYTKKLDLDYTVEYYYEGTKDESKTEHLKAAYMDTIIDYPEKCSVGYMLEKTENLPLVVKENAEENVIKVYYVIDEFQTKEIKYTVEYYKEGEKVDVDTEEVTKLVHVLDEGTLDVDKSKINTNDKYRGYIFDHVSPDPIPDKVNDGTVIRVYYKIDEANTKVLNYTVEYYKDDVLQEGDTQVVEERVQLLQPDLIDVNKAEINTMNKYVGYRLQRLEPARIPDQVSTGTVIKVYYTVDPTQTKDIGYTVEYYKDGVVQAEETKTVKTTVHVLDPDIVPVNKSDILIEGKYTGYSLAGTSPAPIPESVNNGDVIKIYYERKTYNYTVEYYYGGIIDAAKTEHLSAKYNDVITTHTDNNIEGYRFERAVGLPLTISENEVSNVIRVYYIIDDGKTKTLSYKVEYYKDNVLQEGDTQIVTKTVQVLEPDVLAVNKTAINVSNKYIGYDFVKCDPEVIPDSVNTGTVIKIFYEKEKFDYKVMYYYEGKLDDTKTEVLKGGYEDIIGSYPDKSEGKYEVEKTENFPLKVSMNPNSNIIKVYYTKKMSSITVHYYLNNTTTSVSQDVVIKDYVDTVHKIKEASDIAEKYELVKKPDSEEITMTGEPIEVTYVYKLKDAEVIVNHVEKSTGKLLETETLKGLVDEQYHAMPKAIKGYKVISSETPLNEIGKMTLEPITVTYYYEYAPEQTTPEKTEVEGEKDTKGDAPFTGDNTVAINVIIIILVIVANILQITLSYKYNDRRRY